MDARDFERDLAAWLDGELPPERAAEMQTAADASPELAQRVVLARAFDQRVKRALLSDPGSEETVRAMVARARAAAPPGGRLLGLPIGPLRVAAALFLAVTLGMWWLCVPPFECSYMQALEAAARDHGAVPGQKAEAFAKRYGLPHEIRGSIEAQPVAATKLDFWFWHLEGVRLDYVAADGSVVQVVACDSPEVHPSIRRRVSRDGMDWWILETAGRTVVAFELAECGPMYAVTAPATDDSAYAAAKALRSSLR